MTVTLNSGSAEAAKTTPNTIPRSPHPYATSEKLVELIKASEITTAGDLKVLQFISAARLQCHWEPNLLAIVPNPRAYSSLQNLWRCMRQPLRQRLGTVSSTIESTATDISNSIPYSGRNTASTIDELYDDAMQGSHKLRDVCRNIQKRCRGQAHFGPNDANIVKSKESMVSKVQRMQAESNCSTATAIQGIDDAVRGTLSFKTMQQLKMGINIFFNHAKANGWKIECSNLWTNEHDYGGYLDVDARIEIPVGDERVVIAEVQFHLQDFYDGSKQSIVARAHKIYEQLRMIPVIGSSPSNLSFEELNETSRLYFASALFQAIQTSAPNDSPK